MTSNTSPASQQKEETLQNKITSKEKSLRSSQEFESKTKNRPTYAELVPVPNDMYSNSEKNNSSLSSDFQEASSSIDSSMELHKVNKKVCVEKRKKTSSKRIKKIRRKVSKHSSRDAEESPTKNIENTG